MNTGFEPGVLPNKDYIPLCVPEIRGNEWRYVKQCIDEGWVSSAGQYIELFEKKIAKYTSCPYGVATASGTAALHIALLVAGIEPDDEVLVSTLSFIAPANAIRYAHAWPIFVDAEPTYWQMDVEKAIDFLQKKCEWKNGFLYNRRTNRRVKAILPVHILGHPVNMDPLLEVAQEFNLVVIEDATESLGSKYKDRNIGSIGDIACFSFNGNKLITTGGGGMIVTKNEGWSRKAKYLTTQAKDDPVEYIHDEIGYNYRLTNIQAALGLAQFEFIEAFILKKLEIASKYNHAFAEVEGLTPMKTATWASSTGWLFTLLVDPTKFPLNSRELMKSLDSKKIQTRPLWTPLHLNKPYLASDRTDCEVSSRLKATSLSLPSSVGLTDGEQDRVISSILELVGQFQPK